MLDLNALLKESENADIEFKEIINLERDSDKKELAKDVSAMANSVQVEGAILIGISDDGRVKGITKDGKLIERIQQIISTRCFPPVQLTCKWTKHGGKDILILQIPKSEIAPHAVDKYDVFIRKDSIIHKATPQEIHYMINKSTADRATTDTDLEFTNDYWSLSANDEFNHNFFPISCAPQAYRKIGCRGPYAEGYCAVFMPHFDSYIHEPEFGENKSVVVFQDQFGGNQVNRNNFHDFLNTLEGRVLELNSKAGAWNISPLAWSISEGNQLTYGIGAANALIAIDSVKKGWLAGIFQFERVDIYHSNNWLAIFCNFYNGKEGFYLDRSGMKLMLSTIPLETKWIDYLFNPVSLIRSYGRQQQIGTDVIMEKLYSLHWEVPEKTTIRTQVIGMLGRDRLGNPDFDRGMGITLKADELKNVKFILDEENSWNSSFYKAEFEMNPLACFDEVPVSITNPVPLWNDIQSGKYKIRNPSIKQVMFGIEGMVISAINVHAFGSTEPIKS